MRSLRCIDPSTAFSAPYLCPLRQREIHDCHRPARPRFFDAVCLAILRGFEARNPSHYGTLTFDGVDARGAEREFGAPRVAGIVSSNQPFWGELLAREQAIGEGDLKLTDVTERVHRAAQIPGSVVAGVVLPASPHRMPSG